MTTKTKSPRTVAPIDLDALVELRLNASKDELRQQILEEQLGELLHLQEATLCDFLEQLKTSNKELWKLVSSKPLIEVARLVSGANHAAKRLKRGLLPRRTHISRDELSAHKRTVLAFLKSSTEAQTVGQLAKHLVLDIYIVKKLVAELRKSNLIVAQGNKRLTRYSAA